MDVILVPLLQLIAMILDLYKWILIIYIVMSWLENFNIINNSNQFVNTVMHFLSRITEPVLGVVRRVIPSIGGIDLSPIIVLFAIFFLQGFLMRLAAKLV